MATGHCIFAKCLPVFKNSLSTKIGRLFVIKNLSLKLQLHVKRDAALSYRKFGHSAERGGAVTPTLSTAQYQFKKLLSLITYKQTFKQYHANVNHYHNQLACLLIYPRIIRHSEAQNGRHFNLICGLN